MEDFIYYTKTIESPVGKLKLIGSIKGLYSISWLNEKGFKFNLPLQEHNSYPLFLAVENQLGEYFKGLRKTFDIQLDTSNGTTFQRKAWSALTQIPYGEVRTYAQQALTVGNPKAYRAVGSANGKNPLPIIVPCHRIIASGGKLGGFAGGLVVKQFLLDLEKRYYLNQ